MGIKSDLLTRLVTIQESIDGIRFASPNFWVAVENNPFPAMYNRILKVRRIKQQGTGRRVHQVTIAMRLLVGSLQNGVGERETELNDFLDTIVDTFDQHTDLNHPETNEAFRYLTPGDEPSLIVENNGATAFQYNNQISYLGADFILEVNLLQQWNRKS